MVELERERQGPSHVLCERDKLVDPQIDMLDNIARDDGERAVVEEAGDVSGREVGVVSHLTETVESGAKVEDRRVALGTVGLAIAAALFVAGVRLTPSPDVTAASGFAGLPRLGLFLGAALALVLAGSRYLASAAVPSKTDACGSGRRDRRGAVPRGSALALGLGVPVALAAYDVVTLQRAFADPMGPVLWIAAMAAMVMVVLMPFARGQAWPAPWPGPDSAHTARSRLRFVPPMLLALALILAVALRFPMLGDVPIGINADEGDRSAAAMNVLDGTALPSWFDSGWYRINMVYFRLLAFFLANFGVNPAGGRLLSAISGALLVGVVAWIGVRHFGWRAGLLATTVAASNVLALQHSRFIAEATVTALLWGVSLAGFLEGARSGRLWAFAFAGLCGGLGLYFYPSGNLWPVGAAVSVGVLWLQAGSGQRWGIVRGALIAALASLIAAAPFLVHLQRAPHELTLRYAETNVLSPVNQARLFYLRDPLPTLDVLLLQVERSVGMFDRYPDGGGFLPLRGPVFPSPLGGFVVMGIAYTLFRSWRDSRFALLSIWFWLSLSAIILTVETPSYLRGAGGLAAIPFLIALPVVEVAGRLTRLVFTTGRRIARRGPFGLGDARRLALATNLVLGASGAALAGSQALYYYQKLHVMASNWKGPNSEARHIVELGRIGPVYSIEMSEHMTKSGWVRFLAGQTVRGQVPNVGQDLPAVGTDPIDYSSMPNVTRAGPPIPVAGQGLSFILYPNANQQPYLGLLRALYPGGAAMPPIDQRPAFQVPAGALRLTQGVTVRSGSGSALVPTFGALSPAGFAGGTVAWSAGIRLPSSGRYLFRLSAPRPAKLTIDGVAVLGSSGGPSVIGEVFAARGLHFVELVVEGIAPGDQIAVERAAAPNKGPRAELRPFVPEEAFATMASPWGLLGRLSPEASAYGDALPNYFLDSTLAATFLNHYVPIARAPFVVEWRGTLIVSRPGSHRMAFASDGQVTFWIDGRVLAAHTEKPENWSKVGDGTAVLLSEGPHDVRIELQMPNRGRDLIRWNWIPPLADGRPDLTGEWSVVPPQVLRPETPVWLAAPTH